MDRLSYSQLNSIVHCGEQYRLERIVRVPQRPAWALLGGSTAHTCTEQRDFAAHGVTVSVESFEDVFARNIADAEDSSGLDRSEFRASGRSSKEWPDKENERWWLVNGPVMVDRWAQFMRNSPWDLWITPDGKPAVEVEFDLILQQADVLLKGYIDRIFQVRGRPTELVVVDIKTGASSPPTPRQLGVYKVAIEDRWPGVTVSWGAFWDARKGITSAPVSLNEYDRTRMEYQFGVVRAMREQGLYLPAPSSMCGSCSVKDHCYEFTQGASASVRPPWVSVEDWGADE